MAAKGISKRRAIVGLIVWATLLIVFLGGVAAFIYWKYHARDLRYLKKGELALQVPDTNEALRQFRAALEITPKLMPARIGIVRTLVRQREFTKAFDELDTAVLNGLPESEAALLKAQVLSARARDRVDSHRTEVTVETCEKAIAEDVNPAIDLAQKWAEKVHEPAAAYSLMGDLFRQKMQINKSEFDLLLKRYFMARDLGKKEEMAKKSQEMRAVQQKNVALEGQALGAYMQAVQKDPAAVYPRISAAQCHLDSYELRTAQAKAVLEPLLQLKSVPPEALYLMATIEWYERDYGHALEHIQRVTSEPRPRMRFLVREADILIDLGRWTEARAVAEKLIAMDPKNRDALYARGRVLLHLEQPTSATEDLQRIFVKGLTSQERPWPQARLALAQALMSMKPPMRNEAGVAYSNVIKDARATFAANGRAEKEIHEAWYQACVALAGLAKYKAETASPTATKEKEDQLQESLRCATEALRLAPARPEAFELVRDACKAAGKRPEQIENYAVEHAMALSMNGQTDAAVEFLRKQYEALKDSRDKGWLVRLNRAMLLERKGAFLEAVAAYDELWKEFPKDAGSAVAAARLHTQLKQYPQAREAYQSALAVNPGDLPTISGLVGLLVRMNDMKAAQAVIDGAAAVSGAGELWVAVMDFYVQEGRLDDAVALAKSHADRNRTDPVAQVTLAEILWKQGNLKDARVAYERALSLAPDFPRATRRAFLDLEEDRFDEAVALMRRVEEKTPSEITKTDFALVLQSAGQLQQATDLLKDVSKSVEGSAGALDAPRWYLAVLRAGEGDLETAGAMNALVVARDYMGQPADRMQLLHRIAAANAPVRREAAARLNLEIWLIRHRYPGALQQADLLAKLLPDEPMACYWRAWILRQAGKLEEAAQQCRDIVRANPGFLMPRLLLAECYDRSGKTEDAILVLTESLTIVPPETAAGIQLSLARLYDAQGRQEQAIAAYQAAMVQPAFAAAACNELAWLYVTKRNDPDAALPLAEQAAHADPNNPSIKDTLGWVLCVKGENEKALPLLQKAKAAMPDNPTRRYHLGVALQKLGRTVEAKAEFESAIGLSKDFPEFADAAARLSAL